MPTIIIDDIDFLSSEWYFVDMIVYMRNSNFSMLSLDISSSTPDMSDVNVFVTDCILGNCMLKHINKVLIKNCSLVNIHPQHDNALIIILNSSGLVENLAVQRCLAINNVIDIQSNSNISMKLSELSENNVDHGIVRVTGNSSFMIEDCHFHDNRALNFGTIYASDSFVHVKGSHFENNSATKGGAIFVENHAVIEIINSTFTENKAKYGGAVYGQDYIDLRIENTVFSSNIAGEFDHLQKEITTEKYWICRRSDIMLAIQYHKLPQQCFFGKPSDKGTGRF